MTALIALGTLACGGSVVHSDQCGPGTYSDGGVCLAEAVDASVTCGDGTVLDASQCVLPVVDSGLSTTSIDAGSECAIEDNIFIVDGDGGAYIGPRLVIQGGVGWKVTSDYKIDGKASFVTLEFGSSIVRFDLHEMGIPLTAGTYADAVAAGSNAPGRPALLFHVKSSSCIKLTGEYTLVSVTHDRNGDVVDILANYVVHCEGKPLFNYGCIHVRPRP